MGQPTAGVAGSATGRPARQSRRAASRTRLEVLGLDLNQLWDHFIGHTDPTIMLRSIDPVVLAYLTV